MISAVVMCLGFEDEFVLFVLSLVKTQRHLLYWKGKYLFGIAFLGTIYILWFLVTLLSLLSWCFRCPTHYRPERSWGEVIFSQASVILFTGEVSASVHAGIPHPLAADPPWQGRPLLSRQTPPYKAEPLARRPPWQGRPSLHSACWEKRWTSGRYASYLNAILVLYIKQNISTVWEFFILNSEFQFNFHVKKYLMKVLNVWIGRSVEVSLQKKYNIFYRY